MAMMLNWLKLSSGWINPDQITQIARSGNQGSHVYHIYFAGLPQNLANAVETISRFRNAFAGAVKYADSRA